MSDLVDIMSFLAGIMADLFYALDNVMWGSISVLDLFIALILVDGLFWFVFRLIGQPAAPDPINESVEEWGLTDQEREDRAAYRDDQERSQKERWGSIGNDPSGSGSVEGWHDVGNGYYIRPDVMDYKRG